MRQLYGTTCVGGRGYGMRLNITSDYSSDMDCAIQAKREAERRYRRSVQVLASEIAEDLNDMPNGMESYLNADPDIAVDIVKSIASHSRDRVKDLRTVRESIEAIDDGEIGSEDRKLALRVIDKHIKLHGG